MADSKSLEDVRLERATMILKNLDKMLDDMINKIAIQKDIADVKAGRDTIIKADITENFIDSINAIRTDGNEKLLVEIDSKYNKAIKAIEDAIENDENKYRKQFESELARITTNKKRNYDPIAETYKELSKRLKRGEVQRDYFQDKADKKQFELDRGENIYREKMGNAEELVYILEPEREEIAKKEEVQQRYQKLLNLNRNIEQIEQDLELPDLTGKEKEKLEKEIEEKKEEREELVKEFEKIARDKDGNKYVKAEGKSDKDYIDELDRNKIREAIDSAYDSFKNKLNGIDPDKRKITQLNQNLEEIGEVDIANIVANGTSRDAVKILDEIEFQKKLWRAKIKSQGFDKVKVQKEKEEYQEKANYYDEQIENYEDTDDYRYPIESKKFDWRHPILSIKRLFQRRKEGKTTSDNDFDIQRTKKEALRFLENNKGKLAKVDSNDKKRNRKKYLSNLNYNVSLTEQDINDFWNKESSKEDRSDEGR